MKKVRSALSSVDGVTIKEVAMPDVAKISIEESVKLDDVLAALEKAGYPASERKMEEKKG